MNLVALATPVLAVLLLLAAHASAFLTLPGTLGCRLPLRETRRSPACGQRLGLKELSMTAHGAVTTTAGERDDMATAEGPVEYTIMYPSGYAKASPGGVQGEGEIDALLFDCDGTLVDSMPMWTANWRETVELFGLSWDDEDFLYKHAGKTIEETLKILCDAQGKKVDADAFFAAKEENMATLFPHVKEIAPVADIARREGKRRMAVVSSGPRYMVEVVDRPPAPGAPPQTPPPPLTPPSAIRKPTLPQPNKNSEPPSSTGHESRHISSGKSVWRSAKVLCLNHLGKKDVHSDHQRRMAEAQSPPPPFVRECRRF
jgi:hypothetical protein